MYAGFIARTNSFVLPLGTAKTAMIDARGVGEVAAVVLTAGGHAGQAYRLTGPTMMDFHEAAGRIWRSVRASGRLRGVKPGGVPRSPRAIYSVGMAARCHL